MKRFHVHAHVDDLPASIAFYSRLFAAPPTRVESDYAKWMLDDPRINFAISTRGAKPGIDHLGIQAESDEELRDLGQRLDRAGGSVIPEPGAVCCYARSDKAWTADPQGTRWETFHTQGEATTYHEGGKSCAGDEAACAPAVAAPAAAKAACCGTTSACC